MHDVLPFRVCIYVCLYMYVCMYVCMYARIYVCIYLHRSQSIQDTSIVQFPLFDSIKSNRTRSYSVTRSHSVSAEHTKFSRYASRSAHWICLLALSHRTHARQDSTILVYVICSAWPGPFSRPLGEGKGSVHTWRSQIFVLIAKQALCYTHTFNSK